MAYHSDFWVVCATSAPVITLAAVVLISDQMETFDQLLQSGRKRKGRSWKSAFGFNIAAIVFNTANIDMQVGAFANSLVCLKSESDHRAMNETALYEIFSLVLLAARLALQRYVSRLSGITTMRTRNPGQKKNDRGLLANVWPT